MNARPPTAVAFFALVAMGIVVARWTPEQVWYWALGVACVCAIAGLVLPKRASWCAMALAMVALACGWAQSRWDHAEGDLLSNQLGLAHYERTLVEVEGVLLEEPYRPVVERGALGAYARFGDDPLRARVRLTGALSGEVRLRIDADGVDARAGDRVLIRGWFTPDRPPTLPGARDFSRPGAEQARAGSISVPNASMIERLGGPVTPRDHAIAWLARFRAAGGGALPSDGSETSALLRALVLGERDGAYRELSEPFTRSGLAHVLAISGMHLGVLAGLGALLVRATGHRPRLEALAVVVLVLLVLALVPARTPIVRAGVIAIALALGALAGRRHHPLALLAWAGVLILAWRPSELFAPGFQLSFGIVAALLTLVPALERRWCKPVRDPDHRTKREHAWLWLRRALLVSFVAWIVSAPLVAHGFGIVAWGSTVSAVVSAPLAGIVLALGYGAVIAELVVPGSSGVAGDVLLASCEPLLLLVRTMDAVPWLHTDTPAMGAWWAGACTLLIVRWCARGRGNSGRERTVFYACLLGMTVWTVVEWRSTQIDNATALRIDTLALGDGACHVVRSGDSAMLVDCGSTWTGAGVRAIPDALRALGVRRLDAVVVTHPDIDHYACLADVASRVPIGRIMVGQRFVEQAQERPDGPAASLLDGLRAMDVPIETVSTGSSWSFGDARIEVLAPSEGVRDRADNDQSLVLLMTVETEGGARRAIMTGDIEDDAIARLRASRPGLKAEVVEAPHHGANNLSAARFVESLDARVAVQSTGPSRIGMSVWETVREKTAWWTTATEGSAGVTIRRDGTIELFATSGASDRRVTR